MKVSTAQRILILVPYPKGLGPAQRFRLEIYFDHLCENGYEIDYHTFLDERGYKGFYAQGAWMSKGLAILRGFLRRTGLMLKLAKYSKVLVQREAAAMGPPIFEFIISKVWKKTMIYDIDDAIWIPNFAEANARFQFLKYFKKVDSIMSWSSLVIAGNTFLAERARQFNDQVTVIPTIVDTEGYHVPANRAMISDRIPVLGWTGTHSTNRHIEYIFPVLEKLAQSFEFKLLIISNQPPDFDFEPLEYRSWSRQTEISDLHDMDIGLMPLIPDFEFAEGKCGFKGIQFMALELPTIVSPLGVNSEIVQHMENGLICDSLEDWETTLTSILSKQIDLTMLARNGRKTIIDRYSLQSQRDLFVKSLDEVN